MPDEESNKALTDAADKVAEQASQDGVGAEKAKDERAAAEKKVTGANPQRERNKS